MTIEELKREALRLDPSGRANLARDLLSSLDALSDSEIEQLWLEEATRRHDEIVAGTVAARREALPPALWPNERLTSAS
jgi:hypothetical protein